MKRLRVLAVLFSTLWLSCAWGFEDTVFKIDDLDLELAKKRRKPASSMTLKPRLDNDGSDLPTVGPVTLPAEPSIDLAYDKRSKDPSLQRKDWVEDTSDLSIVKTDQLNWQEDPLKLSQAPAPEPPTEVRAPATAEPAPIEDLFAEPMAEPTPAEMPPPVAEPQSFPEEPTEAFAMEEPPPIETPTPEETLLAEPMITVHLVSTPTSAALKAIAMAAGQKIVVPDDIPGRVTVHVEDQPWLWVVAKVLESKPYDYANSERGLVVKKRDTESLKRKLIALKYVSPKRMQERLMPLLTKRGRIYADTDNQFIIAVDIQTALDRIQDAVMASDIPKKKVFVEARLLEIENEVAEEHRIFWKPHDGTHEPQAEAVPEEDADWKPEKLEIVHSNLNKILETLVDEGDAKLLSHHSVITLNNRKAMLTQYGETHLWIKPRVLPDNSIEFTLDVKREYPFDEDQRIPVPSFRKALAKTTMTAKDGETFVIGGLRPGFDKYSVSKCKDWLAFIRVKVL